MNTWCEKTGLSITSEPVSCYGKSDGSIKIDMADSATENFEIIITDSLSRRLSIVNNSTEFPYLYSKLPAGLYTIKFSSNGKATDYSILVESPEALKANKINIEEISGTAADAISTIKANPNGGTPPYTIEWSENTHNQRGIIAKDLPLGVYRCIIDDKNNCGPVSATIFLFETEIEKYLSKDEK